MRAKLKLITGRSNGMGYERRKEVLHQTIRACEAECPKCVSISNIARLNREFICAKLKD